MVRERFTTDIPFAADVAARQLGHYYGVYGDYFEAASRYNGGPGMPFNQNPNRANIERAWEESAAYVSDAPQPEPGGWAPLDVRDQFPYAAGREYPERPESSISLFIYHHGDSRFPEPTYADEMALLDEYWALHTGPSRGWPTIGYHLAVGPSGTVYWLNGLNLIAYHAGNWDANVTGVGCVFLGDFTSAPPPPVMIQAAIRARKWVADRLGRDDVPFSGHKEWTATGCPGDWWPEQRELLDLANLEGGPAPEPEPEEDPVRIAELEQQLADADSLLGYLSGDAAGAAMDALKMAEGHLRPVRGRIPAGYMRLARDDIRAAQAAVATIQRRGAPPEGD